MLSSVMRPLLLIRYKQASLTVIGALCRLPSWYGRVVITASVHLLNQTLWITGWHLRSNFIYSRGQLEAALYGSKTTMNSTITHSYLLQQTETVTIMIQAWICSTLEVYLSCPPATTGSINCYTWSCEVAWELGETIMKKGEMGVSSGT